MVKRASADWAFMGLNVSCRLFGNQAEMARERGGEGEEDGTCVKPAAMAT